VGSWTNATAAAVRTASTRGVLRPEQTAAQAQLRREHPVDPRLEPYVERYWTVEWDRRGREPFRSEVLSHPCVNLSVESGDGPHHGHALPAALLHGVVTRRFSIDLAGRGRVVAAKFRPGGFTALTGTRVAADAVVPLRTAWGDRADVLLHDVVAEPDLAAGTQVLDAALAGSAGEPDPAYLQLLEVVAAVIADRGVVRVDDVAALAGTSVRSLQRLFHRFVGVGPKRVLQRYRLQDAAAAIDAGEVDDLASLAADLGWFDQAHFSRDFRSAVGVTPSEYLAQAARTKG
jgi:AraC-like DNA-binding protein